MRLWGAARPGDWTKEQVARLGELAGTMPARLIAPQVGHTWMATQKKMGALGLPSFGAGPAHPWPRALEEELRREGPQTTGAAFALKHGLGEKAVYERARKLGVTFRPRNWESRKRCSDEMRDRLRELSTTHMLRDAAKEIGRSYGTMARIAQRVGVKFQAPGGRSGRPRRGEVVLPPKPRVRERKTKPAPKVAPEKPLRQPGRVLGGSLEWCRCGAPVSNWAGHYERTGHVREVMLRAS